MSFSITDKEKQKFNDAIASRADDMQALLKRGYKSLPAAQYLLLKIIDAKKAKAYFNSLVKKGLITKAKKSEDKTKLTENGDPKTAINIAFTSSGLKMLDMRQGTLDTFSRQFIEGMSPDPKNNGANERSTLLGDRGASDPQYWYWGNKGNQVDCLLMLFAENGDALATLIKCVYANMEHGTWAFPGGDTFEYNPKENLKEHFGFRDGISQPILWGLSKAKIDSIDDLQKIKPGEFVLGMTNEYGSKAPSPYEYVNQVDPIPRLANDKHKKIDLGENGTYLVFRQIEQHVEKFWKFLHDRSIETAVSQHEKAIKLGAKMIGRWPEGQSLVTCPEGDCPTDKDTLNNFTYDAPDKFGTKCPLGAHVRRTNPRDQVHTGREADDSLIMSRRHRMLRRGRIYGQPLDKHFNIDSIICKANNAATCTDEINDSDYTPAGVKPEPGQTEIKRGLHFICLVSDIERQFEFVQNVWANTPTFADLRNESDPIIGPKSEIGNLQCAEFTTPNAAIRNRYLKVPEFTTVVGGAYFFMPGLNALNYILKE